LAKGLYLKEIRYRHMVSTDGIVTVSGAGGSLLLRLSTREAKSVDVPLIPKSILAPVLKKLGIE